MKCNFSTYPPYFGWIGVGLVYCLLNVIEYDWSVVCNMYMYYILGVEPEVEKRGCPKPDTRGEGFMYHLLIFTNVCTKVKKKFKQNGFAKNKFQLKRASRIQPSDPSFWICHWSVTL